jgi:hypothetical protein
MRTLLVFLQFIGLAISGLSQNAVVSEIDKTVAPGTAMEPLYFLASDELRGRSPQRPEIHIAAKYISEKFRSFGVKEVKGAEGYLQPFGLRVPQQKRKDSVKNKDTIKPIPASNVIGWVEGTDPALKNQYIVLSAHYDHIGMASQPKMEDGKADSIFNGARDNAIGVTAVLNAARYFSIYPPKRSILFILFTAEEMGLIGSRYFSENTLVPLKKIVYNLNCDNGGYNDTTIVTVVGLGRTSADEDIKKACEAYGVKATPDPVPELNLFDRSDNLNLAIKGVPAPTFGMGFTGFDSVVRKRYHQLSDEVSTFNLTYALTYVKSYILAAKNIADNPRQPTWIKIVLK